MFAELAFSSPFKKCVFSPAGGRASLVKFPSEHIWGEVCLANRASKKTFCGGEEKVREAYLFFSEQNVLGWAGYPMG